MLKGLLRGSLGVLEREVMDAVWAGGEVTVRATQGRLPRPVAYTTVMTTLDRLFKKGLVSRTRVGKAFLYRPAQTRQQAETAILSNLVDAIGGHDDAADLLDALEQMVREKKRRLEKGGE
jgi:BlaI family transcriptional regulator, penicillinase repressor